MAGDGTDTAGAAAGSIGVGATGTVTIGGVAIGEALGGGSTLTCIPVVSGRAEAMAVGAVRSAGGVVGDTSTTLGGVNGAGVGCAGGEVACGEPACGEPVEPVEGARIGFTSATRSDGNVPGQIPPAWGNGACGRGATACGEPAGGGGATAKVGCGPVSSPPHTSSTFLYLPWRTALARMAKRTALRRLVMAASLASPA
jgi:hypothetical protein